MIILTFKKHRHLPGYGIEEVEVGRSMSACVPRVGESVILESDAAYTVVRVVHDFTTNQPEALLWVK